MGLMNADHTMPGTRRDSGGHSYIMMIVGTFIMLVVRRGRQESEQVQQRLLQDGVCSSLLVVVRQHKVAPTTRALQQCSNGNVGIRVCQQVVVCEQRTTCLRVQFDDKLFEDEIIQHSYHSTPFTIV